jgi:hypothetical protein
MVVYALVVLREPEPEVSLWPDYNSAAQRQHYYSLQPEYKGLTMFIKRTLLVRPLQEYSPVTK